MTASAQGEDRSDYQFVYGWQGFSFGFAKATEGTWWIGKTFPGNWANLKKAGLPRGAYHFLHPSEDPVVQAELFLKIVKAQGLEDGDMLVADVEILSGAPSPRSDTGYNAADSATLVDARTKAFFDHLVKLGVNPKRNPLITYTNHNTGQYLHETEAAYPLLWFAWPSATAPPLSLIAPFKKWIFWQWGIVSGVDRDAFNGTVSDLKTWISGYANPQRVPVLVVADGKTTLHDLAVAHNNRAWKIILRSLFRYPAQPRFIAYLAHTTWRSRKVKPVPHGVRLIVREDAP